MQHQRTHRSSARYKPYDGSKRRNVKRPAVETASAWDESTGGFIEMEIEESATTSGGNNQQLTVYVQREEDDLEVVGNEAGPSRVDDVTTSNDQQAPYAQLQTVASDCIKDAA